MRPGAPRHEDIASGGFSFRSTVDVLSHSGESLAVGVPVESGTVAADGDQDVPERLTCALPLEHEGVDLTRVLRAGGERLAVAAHVTTDETRAVRLGSFQVQKAPVKGALISVSGDGLLRVVKDHKLARPGGVPQATPIAQIIGGYLAEDGIEVLIDRRLPARTIPAGFTWGRDRLKTLAELAAAWPAVMRMTPDGRIALTVPPDDHDAPVRSWHDGVGGTLVDAPIDSARGSVFNHIIVPVKREQQEQTEDGERVDEPDEVVEVFQERGPYSTSRYGWVSDTIESDAITTAAQARVVAMEHLRTSLLGASTIQAETVVDFGVDIGDLVDLTANGAAFRGRVTGYDLPLTQAEGATGRYDVGITH